MAALALNLLWKEAHELKWKVAAALAVALVLPLYSLLNDAGNAWYWVQAILIVYPLVAGIFFGGWLAAGERSNHTAALLAALPLRPVWPGLAKLMASVIAILLPVVLLVLLAAVARPLSDRFLAQSRDHWLLGGVSCVVAVHVLLLVAAIGIGRATEVAAAGWGAAVLMLWWVVTMVALSSGVEWVQFIRWIGPPLEWFTTFTNPSVTARPHPLQFAFVAASILLLGGLFILRYSRALEPIVERWHIRFSLAGWMPRAMRTPLGALLGKQWSESLPLCGLVLGIPFVFSIFVAAAGALHDASTLGWLANALSWFSILASLGGFVLALLLGVGTFLPDLDRRVNTFWRSRPISAHQWFWTKYSIGLAALLLTTGMPLLAAFLISQAYGGNAVFFLESEACWMILGWIGFYTTAVASTCLVRRMSYAAILAVGLVAQSLAIAYWWSGSFAKGPSEVVVEYAGFFVSAIIACALLAWQAAIRDAALLE